MADNLRFGEFEFKFTGNKPVVRKYRGKVAKVVRMFALMRVCKTYGAFVASYERRGMTRAEAWGMVDWAARRDLLKTPGLEVWREAA